SGRPAALPVVAGAAGGGRPRADPAPSSPFFWAAAPPPPAARRMFNGIHRFVTEDDAVLYAELSATRRRNQAKQTAYEVVQRSQAWSRLVGEVFPAAVRLSIHPQDHHSSKIGFHLLRTVDGWLTPWHGVVLDDGVRHVLVKRARAEELGGRLVWRNSRPSHFVIDEPVDDHTASALVISGGEL
ncbi:L-tyrosine/L-tryptophan isonitrile synthase family protein, partial [Nocardia brasiliensis]|uniref:L-tyrosine/L-tryptophan isonitrile synthase family protein n=1 Tax=Nocardia brasiliensis TaxID=37326 RepID=UPI002454532C